MSRILFFRSSPTDTTRLLVTSSSTTVKRSTVSLIKLLVTFLDGIVLGLCKSVISRVRVIYRYQTKEYFYLSSCTRNNTQSDLLSSTASTNNLVSETSASPVDITSIPVGVILCRASIRLICFQTTSRTTSENPISPKEAKPNLLLIFGLGFGLGLPLILFSILGLAYYCQVVKGKPKVAVYTFDDTELLEVPVKTSTRRITTANGVMYWIWSSIPLIVYWWEKHFLRWEEDRRNQLNLQFSV